MKKITTRKLLITVALVLAVVLAAGLVFQSLPSKSEKTGSGDSTKIKVVDACKLFDLDGAKTIIGESAKQYLQSNNTNPSDQEKPKEIPKPVEKDSRSTDGTDGVSPESYQNDTVTENATGVTSCLYAKDGLSNEEANKQGARVVIRTSTTENAKRDFEFGQPGSKNIDNLGVQAYWKEGEDFTKAKFGQLFVLKDKYIIVVSVGQNDPDNSEKIAEVVASKL
jgi:hypothetical protein